MLFLVMSCGDGRLEHNVPLAPHGTWVGDLDGDGLYEVVGSHGDTWTASSVADGSERLLELPALIELPLPETEWGLVDVDGDGRLDLLAGDWMWYRGTESGYDAGEPTEAELFWGAVSCGSSKSSRHSSYYLVDLDGDSDLDRLWGEDGCGVTGAAGDDWAAQYWEDGAWSGVYHPWNRDQLALKLSNRNMYEGTGSVACSGGTRDFVIRDVTGDAWVDAVFKQGCGATYWSVFAGGPEGSGPADLLIGTDTLREGALNGFREAVQLRGELDCATGVSPEALSEGWMVVTEDSCDPTVGSDVLRVVPVTW
jgi:hypothetical protein